MMTTKTKILIDIKISININYSTKHLQTLIGIMKPEVTIKE